MRVSDIISARTEDEDHEQDFHDSFKLNIRSLNGFRAHNFTDKKVSVSVDFLKNLAPDSEMMSVPSGILRGGLKRIRTVFLYILIAAVIVFILPGFLKYALNTEYPIASIISDSMRPTFRRGDLVFIRGVNAADPVREGEIVVWQDSDDGSFTIHRVVEAYLPLNIVTRGDALIQKDPPITRDQIIGKTALWPRPFPWAGSPVRIPLVGVISKVVK